MDIAEITKVASRKRMSTDVEKLREKVAKENKKIIKLKVAQDTAYWDLKEKLRQVETNHEKLQQNMLEVQMQYETVSGQYQDELRHRAEILNKLAGTREICTVLEDYSERLRETLSHCKADQAALNEAYQQSGQMLREMKTQQIQNEVKNKQTIENLQEKLKLTTEHHNQLLQYFSEEKHRAASEIRDLKEKLGVSAGRFNELITANSELNSQLEHTRRELEKKEEAISSLQSDIKQLIQKFNSQANEMKNELFKLEKELKESLLSNESLKQALGNQETFTKTVCEQRNQIQEKLAALEDEHENAKAIVAGLEAQLQEAKKANDVLKNDSAVLTEKNESLVKDICDKNKIIANSEMELQKLTDQLSALDLEKCEVHTALEKAGSEAKGMVARVQELTVNSLAMETKIQNIEDSMKASKEAADTKIKELNSTIELKERELDSKTSTITHLMNEVKTVSDARCKLEDNIQKIEQELKKEKDSAGEREKRLLLKVEQFELDVKNKQVELFKNISVIMELRKDKERLNETIQSMQIKMDNVQKELIRPTTTTQPRIEAEQDDNAVMLTPAGKRCDTPVNVRTELRPPAPRKESAKNDMLFNLLSDNSLEGGDNSFDSLFMNRRFEAMARGERLSPVQPTGQRRRSAASVTQGGLRNKAPAADKEDSMTLSEVKTTMKNKPRSFFKTKRHDKMKN